jgi:hypothetical protein
LLPWQLGVVIRAGAPAAGVHHLPRSRCSRRPGDIPQIIVVLGVLALAVASCKSDPAEPAGAGGKGGTGAGGAIGTGGTTHAGGATGADAASADAGAPDVMLPPKTCAEHETCAFACAEDAACIERCAQTLAVNEKMLLDAVLACRRMECADPHDNGCRCEAECYQDGACSGTLDDCMGGLADPWCDKFCH